MRTRRGDEGDDDEHEHERRRLSDIYKPVPANFASLIPNDLKKLLEFPGFTTDNFSRMKEEYVALGIEPSNVRHGFIRTKA